MARALRWAAHSAASTSIPTLTILILPSWKSTPYNRYVCHPGISITLLDTLPPTYPCMQHPCHLPQNLTPPVVSTPLCIYMIANTAGLSNMFHPSLSATTPLTSLYNHAIRTPRFPSRALSLPQPFLFPPTQPLHKRQRISCATPLAPPTAPFGFDAAAISNLPPPLFLLTTPSDLPTIVTMFPLNIPLKLCDLPACYTDGSCVKQARGPNQPPWRWFL